MIDAYGRPVTLPAAARTLPRPTIGRLAERTRSMAVLAGKHLRTAAHAAARPVLVASGLLAFTLGAWDISRPFGLFVAGAALLTFDHLRGDPS